jgi:hypothetical protein
MPGHPVAALRDQEILMSVRQRQSLQPTLGSDRFREPRPAHTTHKKAADGFHKTMELAEIRNFTWHNLQRMFASWLMMRRLPNAQRVVFQQGGRLVRVELREVSAPAERDQLEQPFLERSYGSGHR